MLDFRRVSLIVLVALTTFIGAAVADAHECERSCSTRCVNMMDEYQRVIDANTDYCGGTAPDCVPYCTARYSDGSCRTYGADFCGRDPVCIPQCEARYSDGSCRTYSADFCGEGGDRISCVSQCTSRYSDGSCRTYGPDVCGRNPYCRESCIERYSDGSCRTYGPDSCGAG